MIAYINVSGSVCKTYIIISLTLIIINYKNDIGEESLVTTKQKNLKGKLWSV